MGYCGAGFVKTTRRRRGDKVYEYLSLVESVRDGPKVGHRTLLRLGEVTALRESGQLERIVAALEAHLRRERVDVAAVAAEGAPAVGAVAAAATVWGRLGLDGWFAQVGAQRGAGALEHAVFAMVANRLVAPCSKRRLTPTATANVVETPNRRTPSDLPERQTPAKLGSAGWCAQRGWRPLSGCLRR